MNHDERNQNLDMGAADNAALEARVIAWIAGEASAFEIAELERVMAERPELAEFRRRMEATHGLVGEAARVDVAPLRMSAERRATLLAAIGGTGAEGKSSPGMGPSVVTMDSATRRRGWRKTQWSIGLAASLAVGFFVATWYMGDSDSPRKVSAARMQRAVDHEKTREAAVHRRVGLLEQVREQENAAGDEVSRGLVTGTLNYSPEVPQAQAAPAVGVFKDTAAGLAPRREEAEKSVATKNSRNIGSITLSAGTVAGGKAIGTDGSLTLGAVSPPPPSVTFGGSAVAGGILPQQGADLSEATAPASAPQASRFGSSVTSAAEPKEPIQLSAFQVSSPEKKTEARVAGDAVAKVREAPATRTAAAAPATPDRETSAKAEPVSTFSLHVSDVSFRLLQAALAAVERGEEPTLPKVRAEEIYNAFDYGDPVPTEREKVAARIEQAAHPVLQQRNLLRIALRVAATGRAANEPLRLTVLLDTSGSMEREDRRAAVRRAMAELVALLGPNDRITLIGFARQPRLLAQNVPGNQAGELVRLAGSAPPDGGTNLEAALTLARELALRHHDASAQNRIVLLTDGAANLGDAEPARLTALVEELRQRGVAFDACGVGLEGIGDTVLEALTRKGDGRYYLLDRPEAADADFARKLAGAFRPAAENVKVQVRFNPARVGAYRLVGFDQHRLQEQDFRNDAVDAAELSAEEAAVAMYQVEPLPQGSGELGEVFVRFRDPATGAMVERSWTIPYEPRAAAWDRATPAMQLAAVATMLAEKMTDSPVSGQVSLRELAPVVNQLRGHFPNQRRVEELVTMFGQFRRQTRE